MITKEERQEIESNSQAAKMFLEEGNFEFARDYIKNSLSSIENILLSGIKDAEETFTIGDRVKKLIFPRKEQEAELRGQYKWIKQFLADMNYFANLEERMKEDDRTRKAKAKRMGNGRKRSSSIFSRI